MWLSSFVFSHGSDVYRKCGFFTSFSLSSTIKSKEQNKCWIFPHSKAFSWVKCCWKSPKKVNVWPLTLTLEELSLLIMPTVVKCSDSVIAVGLLTGACRLLIMSCPSCFLWGRRWCQCVPGSGPPAKVHGSPFRLWRLLSIKSRPQSKRMNEFVCFRRKKSHICFAASA